MFVPTRIAAARGVAALSGCLLHCGLLVAVAHSQSTPPRSDAQPRAATAETQPALIERLPIVLRDPQTYQTPLVLKPVMAVDLVAQSDGIVKAIQVLPNQKAARLSEAIRLEPTEQQLQLDRAKAALKAAEAATGPQAEPLREVALLDVKIAEHRLEQTIVRLPFDGTVTRILVVPGQFVRAGDSLVRLADLTRLSVDLPVDRTLVKAGDTIELRIEDQATTGTVDAVLPLLPRFEPLRQLFLSVATAQVSIDNPAGKLAEGQTVFSDVIPRAPVTEVPTLAISSNTDGDRRVQVIREGFVRDVPVTLLAQSGGDYVFVTGRFGTTDELVVKTSKELRDGMRVLPATPVAKEDAATGGAQSSTPPGNRSPTGF